MVFGKVCVGDIGTFVYMRIHTYRSGIYYDFVFIYYFGCKVFVCEDSFFGST